MLYMQKKIYIAIDLKSFYASAECAARLLDPLDTNLVVADESRTEKTICLAVSPSLKAYGIPGRARLFEVIEKVKLINAGRLQNAPGHKFTGKSHFDCELKKDPSLELGFIIAPPQMARYIDISSRIYDIYLRYIAPEDIHVYSIDEVFIDATSYLNTYKLSASELAMNLVREVLKETAITATVGIGTNLYLAKIAMDIIAKHMDPDENGVRIASLDEMSYRRLLWDHQPLTDFWRTGSGLSKKLAANGLFTMGDIARCSLGRPEEYYNEDLLYKLFGVNAQLLIDHAWGYESCTIADIKAYRPENRSLSSGQVLHEPYEAALARLVLKEMAIQLAEELIDKRLVTSQIVLNISYDIENLKDSGRMKKYAGEIAKDHYGRLVPKRSHGSINLNSPAALPSIIADAAIRLYDRIVEGNLLVRKLNIAACNLRAGDAAGVSYTEEKFDQLSLFTEGDPIDSADEQRLQKELSAELAAIDIKKKYGKNAMLKGLNLEAGATAIDRNGQIGGHRA